MKTSMFDNIKMEKCTMRYPKCSIYINNVVIDKTVICKKVLLANIVLKNLLISKMMENVSHHVWGI